MSPLLLLLFTLDGLSSISERAPSTGPQSSDTVTSSPSERDLLWFRHPDLHASSLLLSDDGSTLYVGGRDAVLSLDISEPDSISLKGQTDWAPAEKMIQDCNTKVAHPEIVCHNYVSVLKKINSTHLFACGSHAYNPQDVLLDSEHLTIVPLSKGIKVRCPYDPFQRSTAIAIDGELFTASTSDFLGHSSAITRHFSKNGRPDVHQEMLSAVLEDPTFISSSFDVAEKKLFFFFNEVGKEFSFVEPIKISRVAQICKDDVGGQRTLWRRWTSFVKAPLLCQLPFTILQDMFTLQPPEGTNPQDTLFYGVFTPQWSSGSGPSAVCSFRISDVRNVFRGKFKASETEGKWETPTRSEHTPGLCGLENATSSYLEFVRRFLLSAGMVHPVGGAPLLVAQQQQYSRVVAMTTQAANAVTYTVLFLLTESGILQKVALRRRGPRLLQEIQIFSEPQILKSVLLSPSKRELYVGLSSGLVRVPVARCAGHSSCSRCVLAQDPFCSWDHANKICTNQHQPYMAQDIEDGDVSTWCPQSADVPAAVEVSAHLNDVITLPCKKPSNILALRWKSPGLASLSPQRFLQLRDGSLSFLATVDTFRSYHCVSQNRGFQETMAVFNVQQRQYPHSQSPAHTPTHHTDTMATSRDPRHNAESLVTATANDQADDQAKDPVEDQIEDWVFLRRGDGEVQEELLTRDTAHSKDMNEDVSIISDVQSGTSCIAALVVLAVLAMLLTACVTLLLAGAASRWRRRARAVRTSLLVATEGTRCHEESSLEVKVEPEE